MAKSFRCLCFLIFFLRFFTTLPNGIPPSQGFFRYQINKCIVYHTRLLVVYIFLELENKTGLCYSMRSSDIDSSIIITSIGIGAALFIGLIIFWFFHTFIKRRLGADQATQGVNSAQLKRGKDMRRHPRLEISWSAAIEIGRASVRVRLKDISLGGAFVICQEPVPLNEKMRIYIEAPNQDTFALNAEVVWSNMNVPKEKVIHRGLGIRFVQNTNAARNRLEEAIAYQSTEAGIATN